MIRAFLKNFRVSLYFVPLLLMVLYFFIQSITHNLHDFSNSYFAAKLYQEGLPLEVYLFDIYEFNSYIWGLGYNDVLVDFYLNSPFTVIAFYPLSFIENAYLAKAIFNIISILLFVVSLFYLIKRKLNRNYFILLFLPIVFFIPIRNQILFGQSYFLIFSLIVIGYLFIESKRESIGATLLSVAILIKIFPIFYMLPVLLNSKIKTIFVGILVCSTLVIGSIYFTGYSIWETFLFDVLPNAIKNNSTVDFRYNSQSIEVFLKTVFIKDLYYNPTALFDNERLYLFLKWIIKSVIIGYALKLSFINKSNIFKMLSIWVVSLFLLQSRTATYAQILWLIPAVYFLKTNMKVSKKIIFFFILFLVCNLPIQKLESLPLIFMFSRLWLTILLAILFYSSFKTRLDFKWVLIVFIVLLPLHLKVFNSNYNTQSVYVLEKKESFLVYDFFEKEGFLFIKTLGKNGNQILNTKIAIISFDEDLCKIIEGQLVLNDSKLTDDNSLKKKPVLINNNEIYYLTDHRSRRGAFTLKKIKL